VVLAAATYLALVALSKQHQSREFVIHRRRLVDLLGFSRAGVYRQIELLQTFGRIRWVHLKTNTLHTTLLPLPEK